MTATPHQLAAALAGIAGAGAASVEIGLVSATDLFTTAWGGAALALLDALARAVTAHPSKPDEPDPGRGV
ncbi:MULTISPECIES: hypothetical protein [Pseudofrankia]|uniref:hypothetical protein n=1 Tax=Pseudofrankia TaxID=2994363 RepID=UPI000234C159|nr:MULTISPECIES: hypothetical protein [Pseudofrankia]OHV28610.1 hypothetical protein BCD49_37780 [Pseudofrankia sp. EUN1h]